MYPPVYTSPDPGSEEFHSDELSQSPEILYRIFEFAPDAIVLVGKDGRIAKANAQVEKMFGYTRGELIGQLVEILVPSRFASRHLGHRNGYISAPRTRTMGVGLDLFGKRKDGTEFPVDIMLSPLDTEGGQLVLGVVRDVTERKRFEEQALAAREMYLKEVHHRIKNNLQVISSLLFLQSTYVSDPAVLDILKESQSRVKSIALIHEKLYRSPEFAKLEFGDYVRDLVSDLFRTYGTNNDNIVVKLQIENTSLEIDTAIPCGLIINELVSNVLKHAFKPDMPGEVNIDLASIGPKEYELTIRDNGVGMPPGFDWRKSKSLGLKLVSDLTRQLEGSVEVEGGPGPAFRIRFKELQYKERS